MNRLFGSRKEPMLPTAPPSSPDDASTLTQLRETLELLEKRDEHLARLIDKEVESARAYQAANQKKLALECIKRKRVHEAEREQLSVRKLNMMKTESTLHSLKFNSIVVATTDAGAAAIEREVRKVGGIEGAERVMDRAEDALADASELLGATSRTIGSADYEDDELLEELEQMEMDELAISMSEVNTGSQAATNAPRAEPIGHLFAQVPHNVPAVAGPSRASAAGPSRASAAAREEREAERELAELSRLQSSMTVEKPMAMPMMAMCY